MRVALVHSFYSSASPSGENLAVELQHHALERAGFEVAVFGAHTDTLTKHALYPLRTAVNVATDIGPDPSHHLRAFAPDVTHLHNSFPNISRRWMSSWDGPIVATIHNYRAMCSAGTLSRDGHPCQECVDSNNAVPALVHRCYRGSVAATVPMALRTWNGVRADPVMRRADRLIFLSTRSRDIYRSAGLDRAGIEIVPNFVEANELARPRHAPDRPWLCAGRLSAEKGVVELIRAWPKDVSLDVYGDGPLRATVAESSTGKVVFRGPIDRQGLLARLPGSTGLVFPTRFSEGLPTVYLEALAAGVPTLATAANSAADDVIDSGAGVVLPEVSAADVVEGTRLIETRWAQYAQAALDRFHHRYSADSWLERIEAVYDRAATAGAGRGTRS